jgi:helicase
LRIEELEKHGLPVEYINLLRERGIIELNPVQLEAIRKGVLAGRNMVISTPTASGKTLVAELLLVKRALEGKIGIYLTPLRALAGEKHREFLRLNRLGLSVGISTGDYDQPAEYLGEYSIVVATYERFDSIMRLQPTWLSKVGVVVVDEMHNISDPERGPIIEFIVARSLRRGFQVLGLSATIGNPDLMAKWISGELVNTNWRPVKLVEGVFDKKNYKVLFADGRGEPVEPESEPVLDLVEHNLKRNMQTLVFIHNRKRIEELAREYAWSTGVSASPKEFADLLEDLESAPTRFERELIPELVKRGVGFHHAGLSMVSRRVVEEAFRRRILRVVFATPTLAAGINLPARRVLVSVKRYDPASGRRVNIGVSEYKQMAGRAGRPQYDNVGEAIIIDARDVKEGFKYINSAPEPVMGKVFTDRSLRVHVLSAVVSGEAKHTAELLELLKYTFSAIYSGDVEYLRLRVEEVVRVLREANMVTSALGLLKPTILGKITSYTYLDPLTVVLYLNHKPREFSEFYVLHLVALTPDFKRSSGYISERVLSQYEEISEVYEQGSPPVNSDFYSYDDWLVGLVYASILYDWINEKTEDEILEKYMIGPGDLYNIRDTASWIISALGKVEGVLGNVSLSRKLHTLAVRVENGVREDAVELVSLKFIGRARARILIKHGIKTLSDLAKTPRRRLQTLPTFGPKVVDEIYSQLRERGYRVEEQ